LTSQSPVFLVNSRHPHFCAPRSRLPGIRAPFFRSYGGNLPSSFTIVLSSALVYSTSPPVSVSGTVRCWGYFLELLPPPVQSSKDQQRLESVTPSGPWNINQVPIAYGSRPRLRGRLTLRGLTLRRNPWTFGDRVSHSVCRYSCQHSHFRCLQHTSRYTFAGLRNAPLPRQRTEDKGQRPGRIRRRTAFIKPSSILDISWYSSRHRRHRTSSM